MADDNPLRAYTDLEYQDNPEVQRNILIESAVARGLPPNFLLHLAQIESGNEPNPRTAEGKRQLPGGGRAQGILQFTPTNVQSYNIDPHNVKHSADAAADMAVRNMRQLRANFPHLTQEQLLHLTGVAHHSGAGNIIAAGGVPNKPFALDYSRKLQDLASGDTRGLREAVNFPIPPSELPAPKPAVRPASPKPSGAAAQPVRKAEDTSYNDILSMFSRIGNYLPGIQVFGGPYG